MLKYTIKEIADDHQTSRNASGADGASAIKRYEATLVPGQTHISPVTPVERTISGEHAMDELEKMKYEIKAIELNNFDPMAKTFEVKMVTFESSCPHCGRRQVLNTHAWKGCCRREGQVEVTDPAEAMSAQCEISYSFDDACDRWNSKNYFIDYAEEYLWPYGRFFPDGRFVGDALFSIFNHFMKTSKEMLSNQEVQDKERYLNDLIIKENARLGINFDMDKEAIRLSDEGTITFGFPDAYKSLYACNDCHEVFYALYNPSVKDIKSIEGFLLEDHVPNNLSVEISRTSDEVSLSIQDLKSQTARKYQWNLDTGDFSINGDSLAFPEAVESFLESKESAIGVSISHKVIIQYNDKKLDAKRFDEMNLFTYKFPNLIPDFEGFVCAESPTIKDSLSKIKSCRDEAMKPCLSNMIRELSLANRFQGYPQSFFESARTIVATRDYLTQLVLFFNDCKILPARYGDIPTCIDGLNLPDSPRIKKACQENPLIIAYFYHLQDGFFTKREILEDLFELPNVIDVLRWDRGRKNYYESKGEGTHIAKLIEELGEGAAWQKIRQMTQKAK